MTSIGPRGMAYAVGWLGAARGALSGLLAGATVTLLVVDQVNPEAGLITMIYGMGGALVGAVLAAVPGAWCAVRAARARPGEVATALAILTGLVVAALLAWSAAVGENAMLVVLALMAGLGTFVGLPVGAWAGRAARPPAGG